MKRAVRSGWSHAVLVCRKCSKKVGGGFGPGGGARLAQALRREPGFGKGRKAAVGVVEIGCLGICPKRAVTVIDTRGPGTWRLVAPGADVATLAASLRSPTDVFSGNG